MCVSVYVFWRFLGGIILKLKNNNNNKNGANYDKGENVSN